MFLWKKYSISWNLFVELMNILIELPRIWRPLPTMPEGRLLMREMLNYSLRGTVYCIHPFNLHFILNVWVSQLWLKCRELFYYYINFFCSVCEKYLINKAASLVCEGKKEVCYKFCNILEYTCTNTCRLSLAYIPVHVLLLSFYIIFIFFLQAKNHN